MSGSNEPVVAPAPQLSPLDAWHRGAGATMMEFAGYEMPLRYESIVAEHQRTRTSASLFDVSHMGRLRFEGAAAELLLDHVCTRKMSDLAVGRTRYSLLCNAEGGVLDDVLVSHVETPSGRRYFLMVVNAANRQKILRWLVPHLNDFPTVQMTDRTELTSMMAVQGPRALSVVARLFRADITRLRRYGSVITEQMGKPVMVSRTGYTGEDGIEVVTRREEAHRVWENLLLVGRDEGFAAAGLGARDTLRMEAGMPLYGHELSETIDPFEAGLDFAVSLESRRFVGDETLREIAASGPARRRVGYLIEGRRPAREAATVWIGSEQIGVVTSGGPSPTLNQNIAMALVDADHADAPEVRIDVRGKSVTAVQTELPFYHRD